MLASGTPGKRWTGLRVVRAGGQPVGFLTSSVRNVLRLGDILPFVVPYVVGCASILATRRNQRVGDVAAGTLVVRERVGVRPRVDATLPELRSSAATWDVSAITSEELAAVRNFLVRRDDLELGARSDVASALAARLKPRVAGVPEYMNPESFLEQLAAAKSLRG